MIREIAVAMLACARIGAVQSIVFAGFSVEALAGRIADCDSSLVIAADEGLRGGKRVSLKHNVDGARRDADGYLWITSRVDDDLTVAGHRVGTAEIESALIAHSQVAETAVVGFPRDIKGQGIYVYVTLVTGVEPSEPLRAELRAWVRKEISPIATPDVIQWAPGLPKTRSGKIMCRILRQFAADEHDQLGDISTLEDPRVVEQRIQEHARR